MRRRPSFTLAPALRPRLILLLLCSPLAAAGGCDPSVPEGGGDPAETAEAVRVVRGDTLSGLELAAVFGCGACHAGAPAPAPAREAASPLTGLAARWDAAALVRYLMDPRPIRAGVLPRMPDYHLDRGEATAVVMHLLRDDRSRRGRSTLGALAREEAGATAERGAAIVDALNCAGCHGGAGTGAWLPGPPMGSIRERLRAGWVRDYLTDPRAVRPFGYHPGSGSRMPGFSLSSAEVDSLTAWLVGGAAGGGAPEPAEGAGSAWSNDRAQRLLEDHLPCLGCHRLGGEGGRIAPALDGTGARLRPAYLRAVVRSPARTVPGTIMPEPLEDSATIARLVDHLLARTGAAEAADPGGSGYLSLLEHRPVRPDLSGGRAPAVLYATHCAACHGATGGGDGFNAAYLPRRPTAHADSAHMATRPDDTLFDGIHGGGHILGGSHRMPAFGATLTPEEIRGLVAHLRELCRCVQPAWAESP